MGADAEGSGSRKLPWPLVTIDFEASALGMRSFPIEVGIARWDTPQSDITVWSTLIKPTEGWLAGGRWTVEAEQVHSIPMGDLEAGLLPTDVMQKLNMVASGATYWCDGGSQDDYWLGTLAHAAGIAPAFRLGDWDALGGVLQPDAYERMVRWLDAAPVCHRAGDDAERLLRAIAVGLRGVDILGV